MSFILNKVKKSADASIFILILSAGLFFWTSTAAGEPKEMKEYITSEWTVTQGESLWSIATSNGIGSDMSTEQMVHWIKTYNNLTNETIYPGQKIHIPVVLDTFASN
ncbi:LysM repeat protein [Evansella vedderi]|uniref:LysM repeat protein n=1 Tax=Evansella vedderi TaxID=38282 RepID=A0ABT9ZS91_9BACI|nr:LysM peptidoglycan-binding domain-containing protein [Evansella vedderi]MDQ0253616.1 LysM repeat protein [Evansella vedderi]